MEYIAVWESRRAHNKGWETYEGDVCNLLEKAFENFVKNPMQNNLLQINQNRTFDFSKSEEANSSTRRVYPIRRLELPGESAVAKQITWKWDSSNDNCLNWRPYSANVVNLLEMKFQNSPTVEITQDLTQVDFDYVIDFQNMTQTNKQTKKRRLISRDKVQHPYPRVTKVPTPAAPQQRQQPSSEDRTCRVCLDQRAEMAFVPCGHLCCCPRCCASVRNTCPICRVRFTNTVRIYM